LLRAACSTAIRRHKEHHVKTKIDDEIDASHKSQFKFEYMFTY